MKLSVSLPEDDVDFLDEYARDNGVASRSAALHKAVRLLRSSQLVSEYEQAFSDWTEEEEPTAWESVVGDGIA